MPAPSLCSWTRPCWARRRPKHSRTTWRAASRDRPAHGLRQRIRILFEPRSETAGHSRRRYAGVMQNGYFGANADEIAALAASSNAPSRAVCAIEPARPPRNRSVGALNLSTHTAAALYAAFPPAEARRVLKRLEFHFTPKHASWLNMVEIEIGVLKGQCLDRRIESCDRLVAEIDVWQSQRNQSGARINWMFSTDKARTKMARAYPDPSLKES